MTDSREPNETGGELDSPFENIAAYVLDALDDENERAAVEVLIATDPTARAEFDEMTEAADLLAIAVPLIAPPARLKSKILDEAAREPVAQAATARVTPVAALREPQQLAWWSRTLRSGYLVSGAAAVLVLVAVGVLGVQNNNLGDEIDSLRSELDVETAAVASLRDELSTTLTSSESKVTSMQNEMDSMENEFNTTAQMVVHQEEMVSELSAANTALRKALRDQSWLTYVAMKEDYKVENWLADRRTTSITSVASGLFAVRVFGDEAVFQVHGLEQPQPGFAYTLWLLGDGQSMPVSQFEVSEIGSATVAFVLPAPSVQYTSLVVTQERVDRIGPQPSEVKFLSADAN